MKQVLKNKKSIAIAWTLLGVPLSLSLLLWLFLPNVLFNGFYPTESFAEVSLWLAIAYGALFCFVSFLLIRSVTNRGVEQTLFAIVFALVAGDSLHTLLAPLPFYWLADEAVEFRTIVVSKQEYARYRGTKRRYSSLRLRVNPDYRIYIPRSQARGVEEGDSVTLHGKSYPKVGFFFESMELSKPISR